MSNTCEYCGGHWFARNLRRGLVCSGCGASAPMGARTADPLEDHPVAVIMHPTKLSAEAYARLGKAWAEHFPGQQCLILDEGMTVQFLQRGVMTTNEVRRLEGLPEVAGQR